MATAGPPKPRPLVIMPSTLPSASTSGPPEKPGYRTASTWMKRSSMPPRRVRAGPEQAGNQPEAGTGFGLPGGRRPAPASRCADRPAPPWRASGPRRRCAEWPRRWPGRGQRPSAPTSVPSGRPMRMGLHGTDRQRDRRSGRGQRRARCPRRAGRAGPARERSRPPRPEPRRRAGSKVGEFGHVRTLGTAGAASILTAGRRRPSQFG